MNEPGGGPIPRGYRSIVYFTSGSSSLAPAGEITLEQSLRYARTAHRVVIAGRTDNVGADAANHSLALARAVSVRDFLLLREPTLATAIVIDAKGRCCFIASNDTPQGRQKNRRVEVVLDVPEQVAP